MRYAAYGSNLHPHRLGRRLESARLLGTSFLSGWSLYFHKRGMDRSAKCNIRPGSTGVHLAIYEISVEDKLILDEIEGLRYGYSDTILYIPEFGDCLSYVAVESHIEESLEPYDWYKELVVAGARLHGFPEDYLNRIERTLAKPDPDAVRSADRWKLVASIKTGT